MEVGPALLSAASCPQLRQHLVLSPLALRSMVDLPCGNGLDTFSFSLLRSSWTRRKHEAKKGSSLLPVVGMQWLPLVPPQGTIPQSPEQSPEQLGTPLQLDWIPMQNQIMALGEGLEALSDTGISWDGSVHPSALRGGTGRTGWEEHLSD